jgi:hypothetical protein
MKTSRNDPCPCGSGKKYKACCLPRELARERVKAVLGDEAFEAAEEQMQTIIDERTVWEADVLALPLPVPDGAPSLMIVAAAGVILHGEVVLHHPATAEERATTIALAVSTAGRAVGKMPERLHVRDAELAALLGPRPQMRGVEVVAAPLRELDEALNAFTEQMAAPSLAARVVTPDTWRETGASHEEVAEFHRAAAECYRLAPWKNPEMQVPYLLHLPGEERPWGASLMGDAGMAFGLGLYSDPLDLLALMVSGPGLEKVHLQGYGITVDFDRRSELTAVMQREITAAGWPVAGPRAYPRLFALNTDENRVTAAHVRQATLALRAMIVLARGGDPEEETGVGVSVFPLPGELLEEDVEDDEDRLGWFTLPDEAAPICVEGPGAQPEAALAGWDHHDRVEAAEEARHARFVAWLPTATHTVHEVDLQNARYWTDFLVGLGVPASALTEHDLRLFLYDLYVRKSGATKTAIRRMPQLMPWIFRFLEEEEGIHCPFAPAVMEELWEIEERGRRNGEQLEETLAAMSHDVYDDLESRMMLHKRDPDECAGWPDLMSPEVAILDRELQRRWLLWYDEEVRGGTTDFYDLEEVLTDRQVQWENTLHPALDGRTPADVIHAWVSSEASPGMGSAALVD